MRITYFGHSSFLVEANDGTRAILDPYRPGSFDGAVRYAPIAEPADVVIITHQHEDHDAADTIPGNPRVLIHPTSARVGALSITGVQVAHDKAGGSKRGQNTIVCLDDGDIRLVHAGDLGHLLGPEDIKAICRVDVLLIPVGGFFTIDAKEAAAVVDSLNPKVVVPMHYKTDSCDFPITPVDDFLATQKNVKRLDSPVLELTAATLPAERTVIVLTHAC